MMHERLPAAADLVGRLLLSFLFIHEAWSKLTAFSAAGAYMEAYSVPAQLSCRWRLRSNWARAC
jgi:uncharacterized membrane protein YphA (DoxX/SURF4 family)